MDDRTFTRADGATAIYFRPKRPEFEAIEVCEVESRIRDALPGLDEGAYEELADSATLWTPVPEALNEYLRKAIFDLQEISEFLGANEPTEHTFWPWSELRDELLQFTTRLHRLRDAVDRTCDHELLEPAPEADRQNKVIMEAATAKGFSVPPFESGSRQCTSCGTVWGPGQQKPQRMLLPRAYYPKYASRQRPGRGAFLYFATELLRRHGLKKLEAMKCASKVIDMFWIGDGPPYTELQLEDVHRRGRESSEQNQFITAREFSEIPASLRREGARDRFIWLRVPSASAATAP
ncbi:MAG TPA: hypothetical protein VHO06_04880 [Polyangia bacterium]|nr:hypothetical protein [Polyangia bacterium]